MAKAAAAYVPGIGPQDLLDGPAGIRAQAVGRDGALVDDFVVSTTRRTLHVRNAPSPAATSSLALAELIADRAEELDRSSLELERRGLAQRAGDAAQVERHRDALGRSPRGRRPGAR